MTNSEIKNVIIREVCLSEYSNDIIGKNESEDACSTVLARYKARESNERIFEPIQDVNRRNKLIELFNKLDEDL